MANATAVSRRSSLDEFKAMGAVVLATASGISGAYGDGGRSIETFLPEINATRTNASVGLEAFDLFSSIEHVTASTPDFTNVAKPSQIPSHAWKEEAYGIIESLADFADGWDGPGSTAASREAIRIARALIREWPGELQHPDLDLLLDGSVALEIFDDQGFAVASIETKSDGTATYVVARGTEIRISERETDGSSIGITRVLKNIRDNIA